MAVKRSVKIEPVKALAERDEQARSVDFTTCQAQLEAASTKLEELLRYREDYDQAPTSDDGKLDIAKLQENRRFLVKLSEVIRLQEQNVERLQQLADEARDAWMASRVKSKNLDKLRENYRDEEHREDSRREQKHADELAGQRFLWNKNNPS